MDERAPRRAIGGGISDDVCNFHFTVVLGWSYHRPALGLTRLSDRFNGLIIGQVDITPQYLVKRNLRHWWFSQWGANYFRLWLERGGWQKRKAVQQNMRIKLTLFSYFHFWALKKSSGLVDNCVINFFAFREQNLLAYTYLQLELNAEHT